MMMTMMMMMMMMMMMVLMIVLEVVMVVIMVMSMVCVLGQSMIFCLLERARSRKQSLWMNTILAISKSHWHRIAAS
eukprot:4421894-Karenia_brevis.AAC.1